MKMYETFTQTEPLLLCLIADIFSKISVYSRTRSNHALIHTRCTISGIDCVKKIIHNVLLLSAGRKTTP